MPTHVRRLFASQKQFSNKIFQLNDSTRTPSMSYFITVCNALSHTNLESTGFLHSSIKIELNHALELLENIFKRQEKMAVSYYQLTVYNNSMHFHELFQAQIEIFWINTLLTFDGCFQQCSGGLQTNSIEKSKLKICSFLIYAECFFGRVEKIFRNFRSAHDAIFWSIR